MHDFEKNWYVCQRIQQYRYQSNNNNREMHKRKNLNDINKTKMKNFLDYFNGFYKNIVGIPTGDPNL